MSLEAISKQLSGIGIDHVVVSADIKTSMWLRRDDDADDFTSRFRTIVAEPLEDLAPLPFRLITNETKIYASGYKVMFSIGDPRSNKSLVVVLTHKHFDETTEVLVGRNSNFRKFIQHGGWPDANYMINDSVGKRALKSQIKTVIEHLRDNYGKELSEIARESKKS